MAFNFIKSNMQENSRLIIYGYSHGGVKALLLSEKLRKEGINVNVLITVDAAYGPLSPILDRSVPSNVFINVNEYQTSPSIVFSRGAKNKPSNIGENTAKVFNLEANKLYNDVNHGNIDEKFQSYNTSLIRTAITGELQSYNLNSNISSSGKNSSSNSSSR